MFHRRSCVVWLALGLGALLALPSSTGAADFPLKDGDTWVMVGDSITAQHLHSKYFEAFCFARYPKLTFRFRNSGVGGDTIPRVMDRFQRDTAAWKPTVVSVELGMNDAGSFTVEQFMENMAKFNKTVADIKARPVYLSPSPVNNGNTMANLDTRNKRLHDYSEALKRFADEQKAPFADQFHQVVDIWGKNKPREALANAIPAMRSLAKDDGIQGIDHLRSFLAAQDMSKNPLVSMMGDAVHPGATGQLMMAAALLKDLGADGFVSSVTIDASGKGKVVDAKGCVVRELEADSTRYRVRFERVDECLPFPIPDEARAVLPLFPTILELSQYTLKVTGLPEDLVDRPIPYRVTVNGAVVVPYVSRKDLEKGINLTAYGDGPIAAQGKEVLAAITAKDGLANQWRAASRLAHEPNATPEAKDKLAELTKQVEAADAKIREAAKPRKLVFSVAPSK